MPFKSSQPSRDTQDGWETNRHGRPTFLFKYRSTTSPLCASTKALLPAETPPRVVKSGACGGVQGLASPRFHAEVEPEQTRPLVGGHRLVEGGVRAPQEGTCHWGSREPEPGHPARAGALSWHHARLRLERAPALSRPHLGRGDDL